MYTQPLSQLGQSKSYLLIIMAIHLLTSAIIENVLRILLWLLYYVPLKFVFEALLRSQLTSSSSQT